MPVYVSPPTTTANPVPTAKSRPIGAQREGRNRAETGHRPRGVRWAGQRRRQTFSRLAAELPRFGRKPEHRVLYAMRQNRPTGRLYLDLRRLSKPTIGTELPRLPQAAGRKQKVIGTDQFAANRCSSTQRSKRNPSYPVAATSSHFFLYALTPPTYGMNMRGFPGILAPTYHEFASG